MPLSRLFSAAFVGIEPLLIEVEVDLSLQKSQSIRLVGLPDAAVKESKDRVLHAVKNSGFSTEAMDCMIHLAPAEIKKLGAFYDLPIALGILHGLGAIPATEFTNYLVGGELGLGGEVRPISGVLSLCLLAKKLGKKGVIVPRETVHEASFVEGIHLVPLQDLREAIAFFKRGIVPSFNIPARVFVAPKEQIDMGEIKGQAHAKRALEIAAAGQHNVLMSGPPGTGKTMLAKAFAGILPPLTFDEALEVTKIHSIAGTKGGLIDTRPFRAPHHTISFAGMVGGGAIPKPGEISLAHRGVLFLDELPEFSRSTLEVLRQPLENKEVTVSRAGGKITFPTDIILVAAMNPCPCGYLGHPEKPCRDTQIQIDRYRRKISGPLLDRIDIHLEVPPIPYNEMIQSKPEESSEAIRNRVIEARSRQNKRTIPLTLTSLSSGCQSLLKEAVEAMGISARALKRIQKVAQTICDLAGASAIDETHIAEALAYRNR